MESSFFKKKFVLYLPKMLFFVEIVNSGFDYRFQTG